MLFTVHLFASDGWEGRVAKSCMENVPMFRDRGDFHTLGGRVKSLEMGCPQWSSRGSRGCDSGPYE